MIVKWNGDGILMVPVVGGGGKGRTGGEPLVRLLPGFNEVADEQWNLIRPHVQQKMDSGKLEEFSKKEKDEEGNSVISGVALRRFMPNRAREAVKECYSIETLEFWLKGAKDYEPETRDEIRAMIKDQIAAIKEGKTA